MNLAIKFTIQGYLKLLKIEMLPMYYGVWLTDIII